MKTKPTLVIFSGLPGTGKSTLAGELAQQQRWPLLRIDDVAVRVPPGAGPAFWDEKILALLSLAETQLELGLDVVVDAIFMSTDRLHAQELARRRQADFRPVYCLVSDEAVWQQRVSRRFDELQEESVATWERIVRQRRYFQPWEPGTALFVDAVNPPGQNHAAVLAFVTHPQPGLKPLPVSVPLIKGSYH